MPNPRYLPDTHHAIAKNLTQQQRLQLETSNNHYTFTKVQDAATDILWGHNHVSTKAPHAYFDYFFSGQDIKIYVEGVDDPTVGELPIMDFAFNIQQQKTPLFGFWDYTYRRVMKGTRIVTGQFRIATRSTDYMTNLLSEAAVSRTIANAFNPTRSLNQDEANIEKYWTSNVDPDTIGYKHIFSTHPPFNLIAVYGLQSVSISPTTRDRDNNLISQYQSGDNPLALDQNHRLVESDPINNTMRFKIDSVELTQLQVEYTPDGAVCSEVYGFFARDMRNVNTNNVR